MGNGRPWQGAGWTLAGFGVGGAIAGALWYVTGVPFRAGELVALLFIASSMSAMFSMVLPLRRAVHARTIAALSAWSAVAGFFGAPALLMSAPLPRETLLMVLGVTPGIAGVIAATGAAFLARGVRKARAKRVPENYNG